MVNVKISKVYDNAKAQIQVGFMTRTITVVGCGFVIVQFSTITSSKVVCGSEKSKDSFNSSLLGLNQNTGRV